MTPISRTKCIIVSEKYIEKVKAQWISRGWTVCSAQKLNERDEWVVTLEKVNKVI